MNKEMALDPKTLEQIKALIHEVEPVQTKEVAPRVEGVLNNPIALFSFIFVLFAALGTLTYVIYSTNLGSIAKDIQGVKSEVIESRNTAKEALKEFRDETKESILSIKQEAKGTSDLTTTNSSQIAILITQVSRLVEISDQSNTSRTNSNELQNLKNEIEAIKNSKTK